MDEYPENNSADKEPERPLECSECKRQIAVRYTEIIGGVITHTSMCSECPELQKRLHGISSVERAGIIAGGGTTGLACGECGTTWEALRHGIPLGCSNCYEVFENIIVAELTEEDKIPQRFANSKKTAPLHIGRSPGETPEINPSLRLLALNEALNETLKREDYEQAAWLRDQIKALTENPEKTDERK